MLSAGKYHRASAATDLTAKPHDVKVPSEGQIDRNANADLAEMSSKCHFLSLDKVSKALSIMQTPSVCPKDVQLGPIPQHSNGHNAVCKKTKEVQAPGPDNLHAQTKLSLDLAKDKLPVDHALELKWNVEDDSFRFTITLDEKPHIRRGILPC